MGAFGEPCRGAGEDARGPSRRCLGRIRRSPRDSVRSSPSSLVALRSSLMHNPGWRAAGARVLADDVEEFVQIERLGEEAVGLDLDRLIAGVEDGGHNDDRRSGAGSLAVGLGKLPAIHDGHPHIEQDHIGRPLVEEGQRGGTVLGLDDIVALLGEDLLDQALNILFVLNDQDASCHGCPASLKSLAPSAIPDPAGPA